MGYLPTKGGWWQYGDSGCWNKTKNPGWNVYSFDQYKTYTDSSTGLGDVTATGTRIMFKVDSTNNKIQSVTQTKYISNVIRGIGSQPRVDMETKVYGYDGGLLTTTHRTFSLDKIAEPVIRTSTKSGQNSINLLFAYLTEHHLIDEAKTVIDTMREKQMYIEADKAKEILEAMLLPSTLKH